MTQSLQDLGERELIRSILHKYCDSVGDDCAIVGLGGSDLLITTDPVPQPAALVIGKDSDLYWVGWLLVVINASDLAAAGAQPLAFVAAIEAPPSLATSDFERLLKGIREACDAEGLTYAGGNLREAKALAAVGTAIGNCTKGHAIQRSGASPGDIVVSIGQGGIFWRDALALLNGRTVEPESSPLFRPHSQLCVMRHLSAAHIVTAAIDNSDGLLPSLEQLASINRCDIELDLAKLNVPEVVDHSGTPETDSARLWLGWGDWNVIGTVREHDLVELHRIAAEVGGTVVEIGRLVGLGDGRVSVTRRGITRPAPRIESERFAKDSWFVGGIQSYVKLLLDAELP